MKARLAWAVAIMSLDDRDSGLAWWLRIARRTITLLHSIIVDRKPRRVDSEFDEMAADDVLCQNGMWNLEVVWVFGVHFDAVDQFVAIGELLLGKLLF